MPPIARRHLTALPVLLASTALAACGDDPAPKPKPKQPSRAQRVLAAAPAKTRAERTARVAWRTALDGKPQYRAAGLTRLDRDRARLRVTPEVPYQGLPAGTEIDEFVNGDRAYVRVKRLTGWHAAPEQRGADRGFKTGAGQTVDFVSAVTGRVTSLGASSVHGAATRRYGATVDVPAVARHLPAAERGPYLRRVQFFRLPNRLPVVVDVDSGGRIARVRYDVVVHGHRTSVEIELFDFGTKGDLSVPRGAH